MKNEADLKLQRDRAEEHIRNGRYKKGIAILRGLAETYPEDDSLIMSLAWAYKDSGNVDEAINCLETLLERELKREIFVGFAFDELVRIYRDGCYYEKLIYLCERVVALHPDDTSLLITLGDAYLKAGEKDRAVEVFMLLSKLDPDDAMFFCYLGNAHIAAGNLDEGMTAYEKAIMIDRSDEHIFYDKLGSYLFQYGHYNKAEEVLRKLITINGEHPANLCSLGDVLIKQGKVEEGVAFYEKAVKLDMDFSGSYYNRLGNILAEENFHRETIAAFNKAVAADPGNHLYRRRLEESCNTCQ
jgi:tetratricopeptide (TPR) repeat protein